MGSLTPSTISTTNTDSTTSSPNKTPCKLLEITIISAQDLAPISKSMKTYAVVWIEPNRKLSTRIDMGGHTNPTWNDKFVFRANECLFKDKSAIVVEIYAVSWLRDTLVGTVQVPINNLIPRPARSQGKTPTRFVALQVRRGSGSPQGILNMGVTLVDMAIYPDLSPAGNGNGSGQAVERKIHRKDLEKHQADEKQLIEEKIQLWRSKSEITDEISENSQPKDGSVTNGSALNGSEFSSDVGPSASVVAAAIAKASNQPPSPPSEEKKLLSARVEPEETESSILGDLTVEEAKAKGYRSRRERLRSEITSADDLSSDAAESRQLRRQNDGGLLSCFVCGVEFSVACGANNNKKKKAGDKSIKRSPSQQNLKAFREATFG